MRKAMEVLMRMSQDAQERDRYESRLEYRRDMQQFERDREASQASLAVALESLAVIETNLASTKERLAATQASATAAQASATVAQAKATEGLVGQIHFCQQLLSQPPTPKEELSLKTLDELQRLADDLQRRVLSGK